MNYFLHHVFFKVGFDTTCWELVCKNNIVQQKIKFSNPRKNFMKNKNAFLNYKSEILT
jgi:hypothetical protein